VRSLLVHTHPRCPAAFERADGLAEVGLGASPDVLALGRAVWPPAPGRWEPSGRFLRLKRVTSHSGLVVGIGIIASARKGRMSENALTVTNILLCCVVIAGAALFYGFGGDIADFVFQGS
jgi:hypothetical protein